MIEPRSSASADSSRAASDDWLDQADAPLVELFEQISQAAQAGHPPDLEALCQEHPQYAERLRQLVPTVTALAELASHSPTVAPRSGERLEGGRLGDFLIHEEIGRGGMGIVYEAEQISLGRRVALKVLPFATVLDPRQLERFKKEAQSAAQLHHSNIVPVFSVGSERGVHYYAMQFIEGQTLADVVAQLRDLRRNKEAAHAQSPEKQSPENQSAPANHATTVRDLEALVTTEVWSGSPEAFRSVARLAMQAAQALDYAHRQGVVHRDIKPSNLLVDAQGHLWITDFGLAMSLGDANLTQTGAIMGTLRYMSPEQTSGRRVLLDHRTDVYSLGATLYELLALAPMFDGDDRQQLQRRITDEEPRALRKIDSRIPVDLETIVLKAVAKEPHLRYATAQDLADDLQRYLHDQPIEARRPRFVDRLARWSRKHQPVVWTTLALLVVAVLGLSASTVLIARAQQRAETQARLAQRRLHQVQQQQQLAEAHLHQAQEAVDRMLTRVADQWLLNIPHSEQLRHGLLADATELTEALLKQHPEDPDVRRLTANSYRRAGRLYQWMGQHDRAERAYRRALALLGWQEGAPAASNLPRQLLPDLVELQTSLATVLADLGRNDEATALAAAALAGTEQLLGEPHTSDAQREAALPERAVDSELTRSYLVRARLFEEAGELRRGRATLKQAEKLLRKLASQPEQDAASRRLLGLVLHHQAALAVLANQPQSALELCKAAIEAQQISLKSDPEHREARQALADAYRLLGTLQQNAEQLPTAEISFQRGIALSDDLVDQFPHVPSYRASRADGLIALAGLLAEETPERAEAAESAFYAAIQARRALVGEFPEIPAYRLSLTGDYLQFGQFLAQGAGRLGEAVDATQQSLWLAEELAKQMPSDPECKHLLGLSLGQLGLLAARQSEHAAALEHYGLAVAAAAQAARARPHHATYQLRLAEHTLARAECLRELQAADEIPSSKVDLNQADAQALDQARRAVELAGEDARAWTLLGQARYRQQDWGGALVALEQAEKLSEPDCQRSFYLAMTTHRLGDREAARRHYDRAVLILAQLPSPRAELERCRNEAALLLQVASLQDR